MHEHKSTITTLLGNPQKKEYTKRFAKAQYLVQIEQFLKTFRIDKELAHALKLLSYFESEAFYKVLFGLLKLERFEESKPSEVLMVVLAVLHRHDDKLYAQFLEHTFIHYHTEQTAKSKIHIDYQGIAKHLAKQQKLDFKESFGEENGQAFFNLYSGDELLVGKNGKSIKTLRKQVYKMFVAYLSGEG
ncbi:MAG: Unknown protein [uncultured Sulfurovum sp.]|uniref:Uncharacterized protein n=1 Tax=uncultured Sulfurovum sp. TaxID=269237 RepID=A0A6S6SC46_9BACT|nr:MAG: Unknown protein [uncultured Sulfurovum sp.]